MATNPMENEDGLPEKRPINQCRSRNPITDEIVEHIISFLPIKEATQASILSKRFENSWRYSKHLHFDFRHSREHKRLEAFIKIHRAIILHSAPKIETFKLCINPHHFETTIVAWLNKVLEKEPHLVDLDFSIGRRSHVPPFEIPLDLLDIESIHTLKFSYCKLILPYSTFVGLHFLQTLVLRFITLRNNIIINTFIDNCPFLKCIDIVECNARLIEVDASGLNHFKVLKIGDCCYLESLFVDAPTLEVFHFVGRPHDVVFGGSMQQVSDVMLNLEPEVFVFPWNKMMKLMPNLWHVRVLTITSTLLEDLCSTFMNERTMNESSEYFWHLKELQLLMETSSFCNPYDIVKFVDKCLILERLFIDFQDFTFDRTSLYWQMHDSAKFDAYVKENPFLKLVKFSNFKFNLLELKLVKFFLEKSSNLENLAIFTEKNYRIQDNSYVSTMFIEDLMSWRSSLQAKVGVYEYNHKEEDDVFAPKHKDHIWY